VKADSAAYASIPLAFLLWFISFWWQPLNFWVDMGSATLIILGLSLYFGKGSFNAKFVPKFVILGLASGIVLYLIFFAGNYASQFLPGGQMQISAIYSLRIPGQPVLQGILLVFPIAVGEEVYWRGFLQNQLAKRFGNIPGLLITGVLYGAVHIWSRSIVLVGAALVAGLWWGLMFDRTRSITTTIISHSLWSLLIFIILPVS
jgi:membrane protease YdiL (CAAX protease family)